VRVFPISLAPFPDSEPVRNHYRARMSVKLDPPSEASTASPTLPPELLISVVLADDHPLMRRSLRLLLDNEDGVDVVAEADDLTTVLRHVSKHSPHVLVLDLGMQNGTSIDAIRRLREQVPSTEIVVVTMDGSPEYAQRTLDAGAIGFVVTEFADVELPQAVRRAARGEEYLSPRVTTRAGTREQSAADDGLTARETEVLCLITLGHTSAEIAQKMHLSKRTVETQRAGILRKLGLATRAELVRYALSRRLLAI
jgi:two-component system response regulator NreC